MLRSGNRATGLILGTVLLGALAGMLSCSESSPLHTSRVARNQSSGMGGAGTSSTQAGGGTEPATCSNDKKDGNEPAIDCGGACSKKCADGQACAEGPDCQSGVCTGQVCQKPSCTDKVANGKESDADCGGDCSPCGVGKQCMSNTDCIGGVCDTGGAGSDSKGTCAASCSDLVQNQDETGVDCGGSCPKCNGEVCTDKNQCKNTACGGGLCRFPVGASCTEDAECATIRCEKNKCAPCAMSSDCKPTQSCDDVNGICKIENGAPCGNNTDCAKGSCISNLCVASVPLACAIDKDCSTYDCEPAGGPKCALCTMDSQCDDVGGGAGIGRCDLTTGSCRLPAGAFCSPQLKQCLSGKSCTGFPPKCQ